MVKYVQNRTEQIRVANACHINITSGHLGIAKTVVRIKERFVWKGVIKDVKKWLIKEHKQIAFSY